MQDIVIVGAARLPIGKFGGSLSSLTATQLGTIVSQNLFEQTNINPKMVDNVIFGNVLQANNGQNIARQIAIHNKIPYETPAMTVNEVCGSSLKAIILGIQSLKLDDASLCLVGGTESMSNAPFYLEKERFGARYGHQVVVDSILKDGLTDAFSQTHMGITAENVAKQYSISRKEQDIFSYNSHQKAITASNQLKSEITPITIKTKKGNITITEDENIRYDINLNKLQQLSSAFIQDGTVTAGNSSSLNDGAAALLICKRDFAKKHQLTILASIVDYAETGIDPQLMGFSPYYAIKKLCNKSHLSIENFDCIELNEAFAAQSLAVIKELNLDLNKVNIYGGAIALGHPIGASGARIVVSLINALKQTQGKYGLATLCIGGGLGIALAIKNEK